MKSKNLYPGNILRQIRIHRLGLRRRDMLEIPGSCSLSALYWAERTNIKNLTVLRLDEYAYAVDCELDIAIIDRNGERHTIW